MIIDILFVIALYVVGLFPLFFVRRSVIVDLVGWTAFAWGALVWAVASIICLILPVAFSLSNILLIMVTGGLLFTWWQRSRLAVPKWRTAHRVLIPVFLFVTLVLVGGTIDRAVLTSDSVKQLLFANNLVIASDEVLGSGDFGFWGPMLVLLQAPAKWLGRAYFDTLQPAFFITLAGAFYYLTRMSLLVSGLAYGASILFSLAGTLLLVSTPFVLMYALYPHNNIIVAMYLLIGAGAFWMALHQHNRPFFYLGLMAFLGMSLSRTETAFFATLFLVPMVSLGAYARRDWLRGLLLYAAVLLGWNLWLLFIVTPRTHILTPERILLIVLVVSGILAFAWLLKHDFVRVHVAPNLHRLMLALFLIWFFAIPFLDLHHLPRIFFIVWQNTFTQGAFWWGATWWIIVFVAAILPRRAKIPNEQFLLVGIIGFFLMLLDISYFHPFRLGWGDSANRMFLHILPVIVYFLTLKAGAALQLADVTDS